MVCSDVVPMEPLVVWGHNTKPSQKGGMVGVVLIEPMIAQSSHGSES